MADEMANEHATAARRCGRGHATGMPNRTTLSMRHPQKKDEQNETQKKAKNHPPRQPLSPGNHGSATIKKAFHLSPPTTQRRLTNECNYRRAHNTPRNKRPSFVRHDSPSSSPTAAGMSVAIRSIVVFSSAARRKTASTAAG